MKYKITNWNNFNALPPGEFASGSNELAWLDCEVYDVSLEIVVVCNAVVAVLSNEVPSPGFFDVNDKDSLIVNLLWEVVIVLVKPLLSEFVESVASVEWLLVKIVV